MDYTSCSEGALIGLLITSTTDMNTRAERLAAAWVCICHQANAGKPSCATLRKYALWYSDQRVLQTQHESPMLTLGTWQVTSGVLTGYVMWNKWGKRVLIHQIVRMTYKKACKTLTEIVNLPWENLTFKLNFPFCSFILPSSNSWGSASTLFFPREIKYEQSSLVQVSSMAKINTSLTQSSWQVNFKAS